MTASISTMHTFAPKKERGEEKKTRSRNSHRGGTTTATTTRCRYFNTAGGCKNESSCPFAHIATKKPKGREEEKENDPQCAPLPSTTNHRATVEPTAAHSTEDGKKRPKKPKKCMYGNNCNNPECAFRHPPPPPKPIPQDFMGNPIADPNSVVVLEYDVPVEQTTRRNVTSEKNTKQPKNHLKQTIPCKFGEKCRNQKTTCKYFHPLPKTMQDQQQQEQHYQNDYKSAHNDKKNTNFSHVDNNNINGVKNPTTDPNDLNTTCNGNPPSPSPPTTTTITTKSKLKNKERTPSATSSSNKKKKKCRYGNDCRTVNCRFEHPSSNTAVIDEQNTNTNFNHTASYTAERQQHKGGDAPPTVIQSQKQEHQQEIQLTDSNIDQILFGDESISQEVWDHYLLDHQNNNAHNTTATTTMDGGKGATSHVVPMIHPVVDRNDKKVDGVSASNNLPSSGSRKARGKEQQQHRKLAHEGEGTDENFDNTNIGTETQEQQKYEKLRRKNNEKQRSDRQKQQEKKENKKRSSNTNNNTKRNAASKKVNEPDEFEEIEQKKRVAQVAEAEARRAKVAKKMAEMRAAKALKEKQALIAEEEAKRKALEEEKARVLKEATDKARAIQEARDKAMAIQKARVKAMAIEEAREKEARAREEAREKAMAIKEAEEKARARALAEKQAKEAAAKATAIKEAEEKAKAIALAKKQAEEAAAKSRREKEIAKARKQKAKEEAELKLQQELEAAKLEEEQIAKAFALEQAEKAKQLKDEKKARAEKLRKEREAAKLKKAKAEEKRMMKVKQAKEERLKYWENERKARLDYTGVMMQFCVAEINRIGGDTEQEKKLDQKLLSSIEDQVSRAYNDMYPELANLKVKVTMPKNKQYHNRTGNVLAWDDHKKKYLVGLETKRHCVEDAFILPENLDALDVNHHNHAAKKNRKKANDDQSGDDKTKVTINIDSYRSFDVSRVLIDMLSLVYKLEPGNLDASIKEVMEERTRAEVAERIRKAKEMQKQKEAEMQWEKQKQEERARRRAEEEEQEKKYRERARERAEERARMKREAKRAARSRSHHGDFDFGFGGGGYPFGSGFFGGFSSGYGGRRGGGGPSFIHIIGPDGRPAIFVLGDDSDDEDYYDDYYDYEEEEDNGPTIEEHAEALGVPVDAGMKDVKVAFRKIALKYHPDKYSPDKTDMTKEEAEDYFKKCTAAYEFFNEQDKL